MVLNGPNLARLDIRDASIYGDLSYAKLVSFIEENARSLDFEADVRQSNEESQIIEWLHERPTVPISTPAFALLCIKQCSKPH
jgi:3-dehydroquinate dehydratase-2